MIFSFFENLVKPFPIEEPIEPPKGLFAFCRHYTNGIWPILFAMSFMTVLLAVIEVNLFAFLGNIVDWLTTENQDLFWQNNWVELSLMCLLILVGLPLIVFLQSSFKHQALLGNYPMIIRWQAHRYILKQSLNFFNNEFAGRIAAKVMQTSLAVREVVMTLLDVMVYIGVYFMGLLVILGSAHISLMIPLVIWLLAYLALLYYFVPRLQKISQNQADARSIMTGRIVDSYSNIMTVKLFSHSNMEADYARFGMGMFLNTVYTQMRKVTQFQTLLYVNNMVILFAVSYIVLNLWHNDLVSLGIVAVSISLVLRLNGLSQWIMWEVSTLFENIGTLQDGINTFSQTREVQDKAHAIAPIIDEGNISFQNITFNYGKAGGIIDNLTLHIKQGEKVGLVGRSGAGKSTLINLLLRLYDLEGGKITVDGHNLTDLQQDVLRKNIGVVTQDT
ncbi:MAG: ABC transporter ATP-binding protein, partial [Rhizobiales bacterium]|nr:ABC transporter ATP-binding protein [Hyphomicrobiales bacterium]